jgi:2-aminoadipate transaminase
VLARLATLKTNADMATSTLVQELALRYLRTGSHEELMARATVEYRRRRDAVCDALTRHLGDEVSFSVPVGGHHVWVTFTRPIEEQTLYLEALRAGVTYTPGSATMVEPGGRTAIRVSFGVSEPDRLVEARRRLAAAVRSARRLERRAASFPVS